MRKPNNKNSKRPIKREQPKKDSRDKRVNFDNERESKFDKDMREMEKETRKSGKSNDVAWYANNPELLRAAASLPFSTYAGQPLPFNSKLSVPGVCSLKWCPVVDAGYDAPINQAANSIYSYTVHANSRNQSYDAVDEMLLILAGSQVFSALAMGVRAYGLMRNYSQLDKYTPAALLRASGFDPDDLTANYSKMWFDLNELIARTQQIWIPNTMPVTQRWFWMCSNVYKDAAGAKSQYYMFVPSHFYKYDETGSEQGGQLVPITWYSTSEVKKWDEYMTMVRSMISALIDSQDRGIIFGDILKAYGADRLYAMSAMPVDYTTDPVWDTEVLTQIENATFWGVNYPGNIVQNPDSNILQQQWSPLAVPTGSTITPSFACGLGRTVLNFHKAEIPTPAEIMVATRLKTQGYKVLAKPTASTVTLAPDAVGTEVCTGCTFWYYDHSTTPATLANQGIGNYYTSYNETVNATKLALWSTFDWAPWYYTCMNTNVLPSMDVGATFDQVYERAFGDFDQFTYVNTQDLREMHRTAVYSEFGVPVII